jgi:hypothetical protein
MHTCKLPQDNQRKHPLENGSASGFDKPIDQENASGANAKDLKKIEK